MKLANMMKYKDYLGIVEYSAQEKELHGEIFGMKDAPCFSGRSVTELENAFHEAVDRYLADCARRGVKPETSYRGGFNVRISPETHRELALCAYARGQSLNSLVENALEEFLERHWQAESGTSSGSET